MSEHVAEAAMRSTWVTAEFKPEECALIGYWQARRRDGRPPRLASLDAESLRPWLAHLQMHERLDDGGYRCRLSGTACVRELGSDSTGKRLDAVISPEVYANTRPMFDRALASGLPLRYRGRLTAPDGRSRVYRRLLLPLGQHEAADTLLSLLRYVAAPHAANPPPARSTATILGSWELTEADLRETFPASAAA